MSSKNYKRFTGMNDFINEWWINDGGEFHNEDGLAHTICFPDGLIYSEKFYINGLCHREDGPSHIIYYKDGSARAEEYSIEGMYHRLYGPAITWYHHNGSVQLEQFFRNGTYLGDEKEGFWALWENLNDEEKKHPNVLKYLAKYS